MTNRVTYAPQDFQKMCKQAERDHESRKLVILLDRVKRQIAERQGLKLEEKRASSAASADSEFLRRPSRPAPFDR
jgi:hypothetical protein